MGRNIYLKMTENKKVKGVHQETNNPNVVGHAVILSSKKLKQEDCHKFQPPPHIKKEEEREKRKGGRKWCKLEEKHKEEIK